MSTNWRVKNLKNSKKNFTMKTKTKNLCRKNNFNRTVFSNKPDVLDFHCLFSVCLFVKWIDHQFNILMSLLDQSTRVSSFLLSFRKRKPLNLDSKQAASNYAAGLKMAR